MNSLTNPKIKFYPKSHKYKLGKRELESVTTFIGRFFPKFDTDKVAKNKLGYHKSVAGRIRKTGDFEKADDYYQVNIKGKGIRYYKKLWSDAMQMGTDVHNLIEQLYLNPGLRADEVNDAVYTRFKQGVLYKNHKGLDFLRAMPEVVVYSEALGLAGTIDLLYQPDPNTNEVWLFDWKTNKAISDNGYGKKGVLPPTSDIDASNYNKYTLQLNLYAYILKRDYGLNVTKMFLVHLKPDEYKEYPIKFYEGTVKEMIRYEKSRERNTETVC